MKLDQLPFVAPLVTGVSPRRVLIVDDHAPTRAAIASLLEEEFSLISVIGTASNGDAALRIVDAAAPDVVVLDLDLGGEYGLDLMPAIKSHKGVSVIILTSSDDPAEQARSFAAGATAFVNKFSPAGELISAILTIRPELVDIGGLSCRVVTHLPVK